MNFWFVFSGRLPPRQKKEKRTKRRLRFPGHLAWIRGFQCAVLGCRALPVVAAHVRKGIPDEDRGGMGMKPHDKWTVPLCQLHHDEQHSIGEEAFEDRYRLNLREMARALARASRHRSKWEDG